MVKPSEIRPRSLEEELEMLEKFSKKGDYKYIKECIEEEHQIN